MSEKKFTIGGTMHFTMQSKPYDSVGASSTFTIETDMALTDEALTAYEEKINNILKKQMEKRITAAFELYNDKLLKIKKAAGYGE